MKYLYETETSSSDIDRQIIKDEKTGEWRLFKFCMIDHVFEYFRSYKTRKGAKIGAAKIKK